MPKTAKLLVTLLFLAGCAAEPTMEPERGAPGGSTVIDDEFGPADAPLTDLDVLFEGLPENSELPYEGKFDTVPPPKFDLKETQSPVRSQGRRGVCSIFSTVGLMEHLYIAEGTITEPDFSEQFLQWSAKVEERAFQDTEGSSAYRNLRAINRYGLVTEGRWPYESSKWTENDDEECTGDDKPTKCFTNGNPPEEALLAPRWHLPSPRSINSSPESIKAHMVENEVGVAVGLAFFYQSWNHRLSPLPVSDDYRAKGYVLAPNDEDAEKSREEELRAGHSILLMGWDDELQIQKVDAEGELVEDEDGNPLMEKGFFLFKNSWGTSSFGTQNPFGAGYGWISYEYVAEHGRAVVSGLPELSLGDEQCSDGEDNDLDDAVDCEDDDCAADPRCTTPWSDYRSDETAAIPDADPAGAKTTITVDDPGTIQGMTVNVDISHSYRGDLTVYLVNGDRKVELFAREGGSADDLSREFQVEDWNGAPAAGEYTLLVVDGARSDEGTLNSWSLHLARCEGEGC